jgi:hypothetical protein
VASRLTWGASHGPIVRNAGRAGHRPPWTCPADREEGPPPAQLQVASAVLALLQQAAKEQPLLLVVDDLPWLDRASALVLGMVARRLAGLPVALLAAAGHTNKEIAARLFLSPRTVSTHLHQVFPKLGITSRAALRDALADTPPE